MNLTALKELWSKRKVRYSAGIALGAGVGFLYYWTIGCPTGGCPITSNPYLMTGLGAWLGYSMVSG